MTDHRAVLVVHVLIAVSEVSGHGDTAVPPHPWMSPSDPVDARVEKLLDAMTVEEMQAQTIHLTGGDVSEVSRLSC